MSLLRVEEALARLLRGVHPAGTETVALEVAAGRVLAADLVATRSQPPFPASAMDGYAVRAADAGESGARLRVIGESRAGARFVGVVGPRQAVRIFTGAPVPDGTDAILIQENAERDGDVVIVREGVGRGRFVRPAGLDYRAGDIPLRAGRVLDPRALALAASMNHERVGVRCRPRVVILATGDELVPLGREPGADQIVSSNSLGIAALVRQAGGEAIDLGITVDRVEAIQAAADRAAGLDVLVISGGASVGEHDLVQAALTKRGMSLDFWKIAMRPGKPLMVGQLGGTLVLGLPGNPVSSLVCAEIFLKPVIRTMLGLPPGPFLDRARLGAALGANDGRQDYVRARAEEGDGGKIVTAFERQDSSMLATFAAADALIVRPPHAAASHAGDVVEIIDLS